MNDETRSGPLAGVRVLDLTDDLGRYGGKVLAENGADVLRTTAGERGPDITGPDGPGLLQWWHDVGCRRTSLDLDIAADAAIFETLVAGCDILLEAEGTATMAARGYTPEALAVTNPDLVHVSLSPQGSTGPRSQWQTSDLVSQALGGFLSVTGLPDQPVGLWGRQSATTGGLYAAVSALAGLRKARAGGGGSWVDLSLHESMISCAEHLLMYWWFDEALAFLGAPIAQRQGSLHWIRAYEVVRCNRGGCMVSPTAGGAPDLIQWMIDNGYGDDIPELPEEGSMLPLVPFLMEALRKVALDMDATELFTFGQSMHVPFGEVYTVPQVAANPQHLHRGFFRPVADGPAEIVMPGPLARLGATPAPEPTAPVDVDPSAAVTRWASDRRQSGHAAGHSPGGSEPLGADELPLRGIRVLDFTHVLAGPFATRIMADLGAEVIRVQTEERTQGATANEFPYNVMWGRSKRSVQLQMKHRRSAEVLQALVEQADVVIDNFSAGVMAGWGAAPERLREWNPAIISMSMSGCGEDGPWQDFVTYAPTIHALCGLTALTGPPGDSLCGPGFSFNDHASGLVGAMTLLSALEARDRTGNGQHIELSQYEVGTYLVGPALIDHLATGRTAEAEGNIDPYADHVVNDVFLAEDEQWVAVTVPDEAAWANVEAVGVAGGPGPDAMARWIAGRGAVEAQDRLQEAGVAAGLVQNAHHFTTEDPQLAHRDWLVTMNSAMIGSQTTERYPATWFSGGREVPLRYSPSPDLGEHNFEVYEELLGWDAEQVAIAMGEDLIR